MKNLFVFFLMFSLTIMLTNSCKKDRDDDPKPNPNPTTISMAITGGVFDVHGDPINNVTVKVGNLTTTTDYSGFFYFPTAQVNAQRFQITFEKTGYFTLYRSGVPQPGKPINLMVGLIAETDYNFAAQKQINSSQADSIILPDGSVVSFLANSFVTTNGNPYNGIVNVKACYIDPTWDKYGMFAFGGDLYGIDSTNKKVVLNPFIGLNVILEDASGNKLQLDSANNKNAMVKMKIPASLMVSAPNQIEMYVYAQGQGAKQGKGSAVKTGDKYQGEVRHFTYWSCEKSYAESAYIYGYVYKMVNGVEQKISGLPITVGHQIVLTDQNGKYEATVPAGVAGISISAPAYFNVPTVTLQQALPAGSSHQQDIEIPALSNLYTISGTVKSSTGQTLSNASVQLRYQNQTGPSFYLQTITNSAGKYSFVAQGGSGYYSITAKSSTQSKIVNFYSLNSDTIVIITMPSTPGNNKLVVNGTTIFNITGSQQNATIEGFFQQNLFIDVHVLNNGKFEISSYTTTSPQINQDYQIPTQFSVNYGTQQLTNPDTLVSGTIKFTKFNTQGLVEGNFIGTGSSGVSVSGNFSVPYSSLVRKK